MFLLLYLHIFMQPADASGFRRSKFLGGSSLALLLKLKSKIVFFFSYSPSPVVFSTLLVFSPWGLYVWCKPQKYMDIIITNLYVS